jgi:hypothetical protein
MHSFKTKYKKHGALEQSEFAVSRPGNLFEITSALFYEIDITWNSVYCTLT